MNDTPETDAAVEASSGQWSVVLKETCQRLERERDEARDIGERLSKQGLDMMDENRALKSERDEAREERDIARLEFEEISNDLKDARYRIWQLESQIEGLNNFANERFEEIQKVRKERDEAREELRRLKNTQ